MKNIGILEYKFHVKFLHTMMRICKTKDTHVTVFTTKEILDRVKIYIDDISKYEIILKKDDESINQFPKRVEKICNEKIDLLFVNTIQTLITDFLRRSSFKPKCKKIVTVHMANHGFKASYGFNPKNMLRSTEATISLYLIRRKLIPRYDAINVIYPPMKEFIQQDTNYNKPIYTLPFNFYDEKQKLTTQKKDGKIIKMR